MEPSPKCLVTLSLRVAREGRPIGYMTRVEVGNVPGRSESGLEAGEHSGWYFLAREDLESEEEIGEEHLVDVTLDRILDIEPGVISYVEEEAPCAFVREEDGGRFVADEVEDD
ncbi:MAG: DUF2185 domain-containing protein [Planctomycetota bacterium]